MTAVVADTFTVLKPILLFIKCFGLAPYTVVGKMGSRHLKTSILDVLFSVILIGVSIFLVFYQTSLWRVIEGVSICSVTEKVIVFSTIIQFVLSAFVCLLKRHRIVEIANQLAGLNAVIKRSCGCVWRRMCVTLMTHLLISVLSVATCFVSDMFSRFHSAISVSLVTFNVLTFACFLTEFQIVGFFMLLKQLISDLNSSIRGIGEIKGNQDEECPCFKNLPLNRTAPIFVTSSYEKFRSKAATEDFPDKKVILLRDVQDSLCAASELLNSAYSFLLLYTSAKTFICLTHSLYFILLSVFMSDSSSCGKGWPYSYYVWFIHYALKLVWLVFYSSSAIQQVRTRVRIITSDQADVSVFKSQGLAKCIS